MSTSDAKVTAISDVEAQWMTIRFIRIAFWTVGVTLALIQCAVYAQWINADTLPYLDISEGVSTGEFSRFVNVTWSPLFPLLLGIANAIVHPSVYREFTLAHIVNFACFLFAFRSFEFFMQSALTLRYPGEDGPGSKPPRSLYVAGYSLFLWASLGMLTLMKPTPDMLMSAFLYIAAGLLARVRHAETNLSTYALLGVMVALGYLSKAFMFPLGVLMLLLTLFFAGSASQRLKRIAVATLCLVAIAGPYIVAVSLLAHRLTFGEIATNVHLTYFEHIVPYFQTLNGAHGVFVHPIQALVKEYPQVYYFPRPVRTTYPLWYDPYYWNQGVRPGFNLHQQIAEFSKSLRIYAYIVGELCAIVAAALFMFFRAGSRGAINALRFAWPWSLLGVVALAAYAGVHVESRYIGASIVLLLFSLVCGLWKSSRLHPRTLALIAAVIAANCALGIAFHARSDYRSQSAKLRLHDAEAAVALRQLGLQPHDYVGGIETFVTSGWARLARVEIIAEVRRTGARDYWTSSPEHQDAVMTAFSSVGCKAVIGWIGDRPAPAGWQRLGDSQYAVHLLAPHP